MIITFENIKLNVENLSEFDSTKKTVFFLHGFTGSCEDWNDITQKIDKRFNKIAPDLPGHGKSSSPSSLNYYQTNSLINQIEFLLDKLNLNDIVLCGYSMGGRLALQFAAKNPSLVKGLILESATAGIKNEKERNTRIRNDEEKAAFLENNSIEDFLTMWMDQELFGTLRRFSNERIKNLKEERAKRSKTGLANSLRGFGTGVMPYIGQELAKINCPVLLISGGLDEKFTNINKNIKKLFPVAKHKIITTAGHNTHLEEPKKFIEAVNGFLSRF
ncbi:MAG: 2-succinyl-6-hydroxy-2,4-cyclohexadiene-1-carboxylate synthase [Ignavibacteriaceae bacterium]|nr:2-succinyl-6-hydroxy-2,4-cyclohexadiene-1-carboxylate synthase [Ignavibacteriaceae bacterium]